MPRTDACLCETLEQHEECDSSFDCVYDEDYFERGMIVQKSCYMNYSWMPELTIRMAHFLVMSLAIRQRDRVLDFGCAKGYFVKALRLLNIDAKGVDISRYAIENVHSDIRKHCHHVRNSDFSFFNDNFNWMIAKDVFEHISEDYLRRLLKYALDYCEGLFAVVPLGVDDHSKRFVIPEYNRDITHVTIKTAQWWETLFYDCGWHLKSFSYSFPGMKENWTRNWPKANGFYVLSARA